MEYLESRGKWANLLEYKEHEEQDNHATDTVLWWSPGHRPVVFSAFSYNNDQPSIRKKPPSGGASRHRATKFHQH